MPARHLAIGLLLVVAPLGLTNHAAQREGYVLQTGALSDDITDVTASYQPDAIAVRVHGQPVRQGEKSPKPVADMAIQVWLLRVDGSTVPRRPDPKLEFNIARIGWIPDTRTFLFDSVDERTLAAVALSVNGGYFVREIPQNAAAAVAATLYGSLAGTVKDAQGLPLNGARVVLTNRTNGVKRDTMTDNQGAFAITQVRAGTHDLRITLDAGFTPFVRDAIDIGRGQVTRVDVQMVPRP